MIRGIWKFFETKRKSRKKEIREKKEHFWNNKKKIIVNQEEKVNSGIINYIEYENNGDRNINLSLDNYLNKIEPNLRDIIIDVQNSDT